MSEMSYWDQYQFEDTESYIDPAAQQAILEQPVDIIHYEDEFGDPQVYEADPTIEAGVEKKWDTDDTLIAIDRANSETAPLPFRDPVDQDMITGTGVS